MSEKTNLVIVESPAKAATITKYLNGNAALSRLGKFTVVASFGHVRDLPKKQLGVDIERGFEPKYEFLAEKKDAIDKIRKAATGAKAVYIASDNDAEGAFIAESLRVALDLGQNYKRIVFTEITPAALQRAVENPGKIDDNQLQSQQCRRILDRIVGFKLSPLLWKKFSSGSVKLSAGRVQSAVMHLIVEREREIESFETRCYWHANGDFVLSIGASPTKLEEVKLTKDGLVQKFDAPSEVEKFFKTLKNDWSVVGFKQRESRQSADAPFITSTLQQEASSKLRMGIKRVMAVAQELYEGGHITYMRTDSYNMSDDFKAEAKKHIERRFGERYWEGGVLKKKAAKNAQEAHECIRVTHVEVESLDSKHGKDYRELYELIWKRSVAFLMKPAVYDELDVSIRDDGMAKSQAFSTTFKKVKFNGYLAAYGVESESSAELEGYAKALKSGDYDLSCELLRAKNTWASPPARYNEAGLVKLMEQNGIGRPSTYSNIIEKLFDKTYVMRANVQGVEKPIVDYTYVPSKKKMSTSKGTAMMGAEQGKIKPMAIGLEIDAYLTEAFDYIVDKEFTSTVEEGLDAIGEGKKKRSDVLGEFWKKFSKDLSAEESKKEGKRVVESESKEIKLDGETYIVRMGPYGPLVEYKKGDKKAYIGLKGYLSFEKKEYMDVDAEDVKFLLELPKKVGAVDGKPALLAIGPYGPYLKYEGRNVKIPRFALKEFAETRSFTTEQLRGFIEYAAKATPGSASAAKAKSASAKAKPASAAKAKSAPAAPKKRAASAKR